MVRRNAMETKVKYCIFTAFKKTARLPPEGDGDLVSGYEFAEQNGFRSIGKSTFGPPVNGVFEAIEWFIPE